MAGIDESLEFLPVRIAVLTVSDTRTMKDDKSGTLLGSLSRTRPEIGRYEAARFVHTECHFFGGAAVLDGDRDAT